MILKRVIGVAGKHMGEHIMTIRPLYIVHLVMPLLRGRPTTVLMMMLRNIVPLVSVTRPKLPLSSTPLNWAKENGMESVSWLRE
jgi:hypothetical protein